MNAEELRKTAKLNISLISDNIKEKNKIEMNEMLIDLFLPLLCEDTYVLGYRNLDSEINLDHFYINVLANQIPLYFPKTYEDKMEFFRVDDLGDFQPGKYGILEPISNVSLTDDLKMNNESLSGAKLFVTVPGLAFSKDGNRIGHGKGYYDKFLMECENALKIGICYSNQIFQFEANEWDIAMDFVLTDNELIKANN